MLKQQESIDLEKLEELPTYYGPTVEAVERLETCPLCGAKLRFKHFADFRHNMANEVSLCASCKIQVRKRQHALH